MKGCNELRFCEVQMIEIIEHWLRFNGGSFAQQIVTEFRCIDDDGAPVFVAELNEPHEEQGS